MRHCALSRGWILWAVAFTFLAAGLLNAERAEGAAAKPRSKPSATASGSPVAKAGSAATSDDDFPTDKKPWKDAYLNSRREAYKKQVQSLMALPAEQVKAHPAAADFPGLPPAKAAKVTRKVRIDPAVSRWHSTGLYAAPGQLISVTVPAAATESQRKLEVRIGCHTDRLWNEKITKWQRVPEISRAFPISSTTTRAANAFGGLIYIAVPNDCPAKPFEATIEGGIPAPYFVQGVTSPERWRREIRLAPAPWAELECKGIIYSLPSETIRRLDDPQTVLKFWDQIVAAEDELSGKTDRTSPERMVFDRQISLGYMHSGYPIMGPTSAAAKVVGSLPELKKGNWGVYHELGHNHQNRAWTFDGAGEVTCNLFTMYCYEKVCGVPRSEGHDLHSPKLTEKVRQYLASGTFDAWKSDPFVALMMYDQLIEGFGWEPFKKVFAEYRDAPKSELPTNDDQRRDQWMVRFSRTVGRNLGPFFQTWKVPTSDAARESIKDLPAWQPGQRVAPATLPANSSK